MKKSLRIARGTQLVGALLLVIGVVSCSTRGDPQLMSMSFLLGFVMIVGAKAFEWMTKE